MNEKNAEALRVAQNLTFTIARSIGDELEAADHIRRLVSENEAQAAEIARLRKDAARYRVEIDHARGMYESAVKTLVGIHSLMYPPIFTTPEGVTMAFRPKSIDPHELLQELSDRIRAIDAALNTKEQQP